MNNNRQLLQFFNFMIGYEFLDETRKIETLSCKGYPFQIS